MSVPDKEAREHILRVLCAPLLLDGVLDLTLLATS